LINICIENTVSRGAASTLSLNMNGTFTSKIFPAWKSLFMQSRTEEFSATLEGIDSGRVRPKNSELYEEFSRCSISDTIQLRRTEYGKADSETRKKLIMAVDEEIRDFALWLSKTKNLEPALAHFYAISLKSLLIGFEFGVQVAQLFDVVLNRIA
jgi:hypothetical protein